MDCSRAKIGATRAYNLAKEMVGSYENVGATCSDFKNFARDVKLGIGENDACLILDKFKTRGKSKDNNFFLTTRWIARRILLAFFGRMQ